MKKLLVLGAILLSTSVFSSDKGNGGGIHYCEGHKTQNLYDIYEAEARYGLQVIKSDKTFNELIEFAIKKIADKNEYIGRLVKEQINYINDGHLILRSKVKLVPINDATILLTDEGCSYKQLANWDEVSGNLIVNKDYFDQLNTLNKAALYIHEALYKVGRDQKLLSLNENKRVVSDEVRRMVGEIFSTNNSMASMWDIVDPQIEIDRQNALLSVIKNNIDSYKSSCVKAAQEYDEYITSINTKDGSLISDYMQYYSNKKSICNNHRTSLYYMRAPIGIDYSKEALMNMTIFDYYQEVGNLIEGMKLKHEVIMKEFQNSKIFQSL